MGRPLDSTNTQIHSVRLSSYYFESKDALKKLPMKCADTTAVLKLHSA